MTLDILSGIYMFVKNEFCLHKKNCFFLKEIFFFQTKSFYLRKNISCTELEHYLMTSETTNLIFRYVMEHPESEIRDIAEGISINRQLVSYHIDSLMKNGLLVKKNLRSLIIYSCTIDDEETRNILKKTDDTIIELFEKVNNSGAVNSVEVVKQLISAYVDVAIEENIDIEESVS